MALMISLKDAEFMETSWAYYLFPDHEEIPIKMGFSRMHLAEP